MTALQCTQYVQEFINVDWFGDAWEWWYNTHWPKSTTPMSGDIAVWQPGVGGASSVGHVAMVTKVDPDGTFWVSQANWPEGTVGTTMKVTWRPGIGFIHPPATARTSKYASLITTGGPDPTRSAVLTAAGTPGATAAAAAPSFQQVFQSVLFGPLVGLAGAAQQSSTSNIDLNPFSSVAAAISSGIGNLLNVVVKAGEVAIGVGLMAVGFYVLAKIATATDAGQSVVKTVKSGAKLATRFA